MGLKINNSSIDRAIVDLYGDIGDEFGGITSDQIRKELAQIPSNKAIELHIHSGGGSFFEAVAIHSTLKQRKGEVHVVVDGLAASAASLIAMAGKTITMAKHSSMMMHEAEGGKSGRASAMRALADRLDAVNRDIVAIYSKRWKGTEAELVAALDAETWLSAEEAVAAGLADFVGESLAIAACLDNSRFHYKNVPQEILNAKATFPQLAEAEAVIDELFSETK